ncbi:hypothetical protein [Paenibacillus hexagrammi]|uniref:Uncharacterized protein n=1 Tax=Paenibacillus hexagrammi TaxID=2908839 RepID=A0ABY3SE02_9BACL|nr:hypothetical protein [Paenibacillus sp. YPD9-1]UJF31695.1 hypothetical protein L0M14_18145 [Paenibacillus sp. YPD9-1]
MILKWLAFLFGVVVGVVFGVWRAVWRHMTILNHMVEDEGVLEILLENV